MSSANSSKDADDKLIAGSVQSNSAASKSAQFCAGCGAKIAGDASSCWRCGRFFQSRASGTWSVRNSFYRLPALRTYRSAPPIRRILAALADSTFMLGFIVITELAANFLLKADYGPAAQILGTVVVVAVLTPILYCLILDGSKMQGTLGKVFFDLKVTDLSDRPAGAGGAFRRFAAKSIFVIPSLVVLAAAMHLGAHLSAFALCLTVLGIPLALYTLDVSLAFTNEENRTLVDRLSGTMVLRR